VKQLCVGVNKMDSDTAGYKEERYNEIKDEMKHMLTKVWSPSDVPHVLRSLFAPARAPIFPVVSIYYKHFLLYVRE
jgi:hypothetical protein